MHNENESGKIEPINNTKGFLALPFDADQFKDFLIGLLGKPQIIRKTIYGSFEIELADIQNFHHLIEQRIHQQNNGKLLQFRANVKYDDMSSVELNSFDELVTYNEIRPIISTGIELSWDYLIQFSDKEIPEKQTITIDINAGSELRFGAHNLTLLPLDLRKTGRFYIEIHHTARTWASDIESMLTNHIESLLKPPNKLRDFLEKNDGAIGLLVGTLFTLSALVASLLPRIVLSISNYLQWEI